MAEAVRRLTEAGIERFKRYLRSLREGGTAVPPRALLTDAEASEPLVPERFLEYRIYGTRLDAARELATVFGGVPALEEDVGLWSWLSLFYFDQVCPVRPEGTRSPGRDYRHILEPGYRHGHRHLLAGAVLVYRPHGEKAQLLLSSKLHEESAFHHEIASRQAFVSNRSIVEAANMLYLDERTGRPKRGAQDTKRGPGALRRFVDVVQQLDVNYDLYSMTGEAIVDLLPDEFTAWKPRKTGGSDLKLEGM